MIRRLADPFVSSVLALVALGATGFVVLALTWRGAAAQVDVASQIPFLVSGGIGGLALVGFTGGALLIQKRRWERAQRRAELHEAVVAAQALLLAVRAAPRRNQR